MLIKFAIFISFFSSSSSPPLFLIQKSKKNSPVLKAANIMINLSSKFLFLYFIHLSFEFSLVSDDLLDKNGNLKTLIQTLSSDNLKQNLFVVKSNGYELQDETQDFLNDNKVLIEKLFSHIEQPNKEQTFDGMFNKIFKVIQKFLPKSEPLVNVQDQYFNMGPSKLEFHTKENASHKGITSKLDRLVESIMSTSKVNLTITNQTTVTTTQTNN
jgi:hypothetical protein